MNRIVLIGNGFDLAHGLKTSYKDFIKYYWEGFMYYCISQDRLNSYGEYKYDCIKLRLPNEGETLSQHLTDAEYPYRYPYKLAVDYNELKEFIIEYNKQHKNIEFNIDNKFLTHLLDISNENKSWVDIENEYYKFLCGTFVASTGTQYQLYYVEDLNPDFEHLKNKLSEYLISLLESKTIVLSDKIKRIIYSPFYVEEFTESAKNELITNEAQKIEELKSKDRNDESYTKKTLELLSNIPNVDKDLLQIKTHDRKFWERFFDLQPDDILFLNFNYTDLEKLYIDPHKPVNNKFIPMDIHIHGELNNPNNPIIFGYGDEIEENYSKLENLNDNAYLENIKSIKYQETDNYKRMLNFINSDKYQLIILGHSCGNSDRTLLNTLFEHENCVSIKPYYYQYRDDKGEIKDNYSDIVRNISRSFKDKKSMRDKVVNKTYTTWFSSDIKE